MSKHKHKDEPAAEELAPAPRMRPAIVARSGRLYCTHGGTGVSFMNEAGDEVDEVVPIDPACCVKVNGFEVPLSDLRRGDRLSMTGDPVTEIVADR